jgi:hypothetical protein
MAGAGGGEGEGEGEGEHSRRNPHEGRYEVKRERKRINYRETDGGQNKSSSYGQKWHKVSHIY